MREEQLEGRGLGGRRAGWCEQRSERLSVEARARDGHGRHRLGQAREIEERVGSSTCRKLPPTIRATRSPPSSRKRGYTFADNPARERPTAVAISHVRHRGYFTDGTADR